MSPKEFFSHERARRTSLSDTALTTSQTGYSQRALIKFMEKMVVHNDGSVRCVCSKRVYEEAFGADGIDPCKRLKTHVRSNLAKDGNIQGKMCLG